VYPASCANLPYAASGFSKLVSLLYKACCAVAGGLQEAAQEDATVGSVAKAGITGGVTSKVLSGIHRLIQRLKGTGT